VISKRNALGTRITRLAAVLGCMCAIGSLPAQDAPERRSGRVRRIVIETADVFTESEAAHNILFGFANAFHRKTRTEVVRREFWFDEGDWVEAREIAELERNIRALSLFGDVLARTESVPDTDEIDVIVTTRDRFTLSASASVGNVGGVQKLDVRAAESNLFGTGKGLFFAAKYDDFGHVSSISYDDPQFLGTWHQLQASIGETDEGNFVSFDLSRPFRHLGDPVSYGLSTFHGREDVDRFRGGEDVAQIPLGRNELRLFWAIGSGPRNARSSIGLDARFAVRDYGTVTGSAAGFERVPNDTRQCEIGPVWTYDRREVFTTITGLDTLDYRQDIILGHGASLRTSLRLRDEELVGTDLQPLLEARGYWAAQPLESVFLTAEAAFETRFGDSGRMGSRGRLAWHGYWTALPAQTIAASLTYDSVLETQDLLPQLTLGEDNGLRGYPSRQFTGTRIARLNLEDRVDTGIEVLSLRLGLAAFCDVGWIHDPFENRSFSDPLVSAGFGLRIGSSNLLGSRILRVDVAFPLSDVVGEDFGMSVSFSTGQVFTFFGNASELGGF
jgi:hypothetical protein